MNCKFLIILLASLSQFSLWSQRNVDLKLQLSSSSSHESCFDVQLRSPDGYEIDLAGQNYRLFYNARDLSFNQKKLGSQLNNNAYSKPDVINTEDDNIGFLSISIDAKVLSPKGIALSKNGEWLNTLNLCFSRLTDNPFDLTWASRKKTLLFATAEVAMSEWVTEESQQILLPNALYDFSSIDEHNLLNSDLDISVFPNPVADYLNISFENHATGRILIKDVIGRQVALEEIEEVQSLRYDMTAWPEGSYTITLLNHSGERLSTENVIKINR